MIKGFTVSIIYCKARQEEPEGEQIFTYNMGARPGSQVHLEILVL